MLKIHISNFYTINIKNALMKRRKMRKSIKKESLLTQSYLKKILHYDSLTGIFTWIERPLSAFAHCKCPIRACNTWNTRYAGVEAGCIQTSKKRKTSYIDIRVNINKKKKSYGAHRLVFLYLNGRFPKEQVDHIDGNGLNNQRGNLREVTHQENHKNMPMKSNNTSGCVGVYWRKRAQKWQVYIKVNGKSIHGGYFANKEDAIARRKKMEIEYKFHENHGRN